MMQFSNRFTFSSKRLVYFSMNSMPKAYLPISFIAQFSLQCCFVLPLFHQRYVLCANALSREFLTMYTYIAITRILLGFSFSSLHADAKSLEIFYCAMWSTLLSSPVELLTKTSSWSLWLESKSLTIRKPRLAVMASIYLTTTSNKHQVKKTTMSKFNALWRDMFLFATVTYTLLVFFSYILRQAISLLGSSTVFFSNIFFPLSVFLYVSLFFSLGFRALMFSIAHNCKINDHDLLQSIF